MSRSVLECRNGLIQNLVNAAALLGITINPNDWTSVPGSLSETDYKLLLLDTIANGLSYEEQQQDLFTEQQENLIAASAPQTLSWFQYQFLNMQYNAITPIIPSIQASTGVTPLAVIWSQPANPANLPIAFCIAQFGSAGRCLIKIASSSGGLPVPVSGGVLGAATSFSNLIAAPGISYVVTSAVSDWLFLQLDVWYQGAYSSTIFASVQTAITNFLNDLSQSGFANNLTATMRISALEQAILNVTGVQDVEFVNVWARPDLAYPTSTTNTFGTAIQQQLVLNNTELQRSFTTIAGYISLENGTSSGSPSPSNTQLNDLRGGVGVIKNLNLIAV